jgi:hypothetical protein
MKGPGSSPGVGLGEIPCKIGSVGVLFGAVVPLVVPFSLDGVRLRRPGTTSSRRRVGAACLAGIKPGDIVRVHDGLAYLAEVIGQDGAAALQRPWF